MDALYSSILNDGFAVLLLLLWTVFSSGGYYLFIMNRDVAFKKKYYAWFYVFIAIVFLVSGFYVVPPSSTMGLVLTIPVVIFITALNIAFTQFCEQCGETVFNKSLFTSVEYCPHCGERLNG